MNGKDVFVSSVYNGKTLGLKYLKNNSGKLYQLGTSGTGTGVSSWNDLLDKPTTLLGYGIEGEVESKIDAAVAGISGASGASSFDDLTDIPTTIAGYGIEDAYTKTAVDGKISDIIGMAPASLDTLKEIADTITADQGAVATLTSTVNGKADKATTLSGYGITDAYTKTVLDGYLSAKLDATANAVSATKLQTARTINGVSFDGTADITIDVGSGSGSGQMLGTAEVKAVSFNSNTINEALVVAAGTNGSAVGPVSIGSNGSVTVSDGSRFVII